MILVVEFFSLEGVHHAEEYAVAVCVSLSGVIWVAKGVAFDVIEVLAKAKETRRKLRHEAEHAARIHQPRPRQATRSDEAKT